MAPETATRRARLAREQPRNRPRRGRRILPAGVVPTRTPPPDATAHGRYGPLDPGPRRCRSNTLTARKGSMTPDPQTLAGGSFVAAALDALLETVPAAIAVVDLDGRVLLHKLG